MTTTASPSWGQKGNDKPVGFELQFHGVKDACATASYDIDIRFHGATEDWEYDTWFGVLPYDPQQARKAFESLLKTDKIETAKFGENGLVIVGYRTPDGKLNLVKSVNITPRNGTTEDKMPTIKDTRLKADYPSFPRSAWRTSCLDAPRPLVNL